MPSRLRRRFCKAFRHAGPWAGVSGIFTQLGMQLGQPNDKPCYIAATVFSMVAVFIKAPSDNIPPPGVGGRQ